MEGWRQERSGVVGADDAHASNPAPCMRLNRAKGPAAADEGRAGGETAGDGSSSASGADVASVDASRLGADSCTLPNGLLYSSCTVPRAAASLETAAACGNPCSVAAACPCRDVEAFRSSVGAAGAGCTAAAGPTVSCTRTRSGAQVSRTSPVSPSASLGVRVSVVALPGGSPAKHTVTTSAREASLDSRARPGLVSPDREATFDREALRVVGVTGRTMWLGAKLGRESREAACGSARVAVVCCGSSPV